MRPIKLIPINFESASPSTRFPAMETIIMAKAIPVRLLIREAKKRAAKDADDILKIAVIMIVVINAHIIGRPIRADK